MTTPSKSDGASKKTQEPPSKPSLFKRLLVIGVALGLVSVLLMVAVLMAPARWSPWLQQELSRSSGLEVSWDRFAWRGFGGFQIVNLEVNAPDGSLTLSVPRVPFGWSLGINQNPSLKIAPLEIRGIAVSYRLTQDSSSEDSPESSPGNPLSPSEYEALLQAKLIEIQSLASVLDSLPLTVALGPSVIEVANLRVEYPGQALTLECLNLEFDAAFLLSPKSQRRNATFGIKLPKSCEVAGKRLESDGKLTLEADSERFELEFQSASVASYEGIRIPATLDLGLELTTDLKTLNASIRDFQFEPFFAFRGASAAELHAPASLRFEPMTIEFRRDGLPNPIIELLEEKGVWLNSGTLSAETKIAQLKLSEFLSQPLESLQLETHLKVNGVNLGTRGISLTGLAFDYNGQLSAGRLTGQHSTTISTLSEIGSGVKVRGIGFHGADDIRFAALHGESVEVVIPGTYQLRVASVAHEQGELRDLSIGIRPQVGMRGLEPAWLLAKPKIRFAHIATDKARLDNFVSEVQLRFIPKKEEAKLRANWSFDTLRIFEPTQGVAESALHTLGGNADLQWKGRNRSLFLRSLEQSLGEWGALKLENVDLKSTPTQEVVTSGDFEAWWKEVPDFAGELLSKFGVNLESEGATRWSWSGTIPELPELREDICHIETLSGLVDPSKPSFSVTGDVRLNSVDFSDASKTLTGGSALIGLSYKLNELLRLNIKGTGASLTQENLSVEDVMFEAGASLTSRALAIEHALTLGSVSKTGLDPINGHVASGTMEYRFDTSRVNGEISLNNQRPMLDALARFQGESFGTWLCNSGILEGNLLGLPLLTSSLELRVGEKGKTLTWGERNLDGRVKLDAKVILQEKQVDLEGELTFANNDIGDPQFSARGISGNLPVTQRFLYRSSGEDCITLSLFPEQLCMVVGGQESVVGSVYREPTIRVAELTSQELSVSRMSAEASYTGGWFGLRDYSAQFLDGDLRGDIYFGINELRGFDSRFSLKVSDLQLSRLLPKKYRRGKKTRANLVFDAGLSLAPGVSDLSVDLAVTRLEPDALDALLHALEQKTGLAQISDARSNLAWIDFRGMNVWIRHEGLNVELDYDPIVIGYRPIPRSLMKRYSLRDWIFEPIIEAQMVPILSELLDWETRDVL